MNECSWEPKLVTLVDGSQVLSDSEPWRAECEARHMLSYPLGLDKGQTGETRKAALERITAKRGPEAGAALSAMMDAVEPDHILRLANKHQRNRYIDTVRQFVGENAAEHLRNRTTSLYRERAAASDCAAPSA